MSAQVFGTALNPQNLQPFDLNISTTLYTSIVPPYQNLSSGSYTVWINGNSDTYFQTRDRGQVQTSNFSYSTVALSLFGSSNSQFIFQNMRDYNYFPLVSRTSPFATQTIGVAWNGNTWMAVGSGSNTIATSTDGLAWIPRDRGNLFGATSGVWSVVWNPNTSQWLVCGSNQGVTLSNVVAVSSDNGVTWQGVPGSAINGGSTSPMGRPGWSPSPPLLICGRTNTAECATSTNGIGPYVFRFIGAQNFLQVVWNGTMWVGAANSLSNQYSYDGLTWLNGSSVTAFLFRAVTWSPTLGLWLAAGTSSGGGTIPPVYHSYNGINWVQSTFGNTTGSTTIGFFDIIWTGTLFVAVGANSGFGAASSTNGTAFTLQATTLFTGQANGVAFSPTLGLYVAVGNDSTNNIATSTNLTSWTGRTGFTIFSTRGIGVAWSPQLSMFVAVGVGTNTIAYSFNGINWVGLGNGPNVFTSEGTGILWIPELLLWVATGTGTNSILTSTDGINWTNRSTTGVNNLGIGVAWSPDQYQYVMVGVGDHRIATSSDGLTWVGRTGSTVFSTQGNGIIWVSPLAIWIAVGSGTNTIATSPDGIAWTGRGATIFTTAGFAVAWNGSLLVAVGQGTNTIATSLDGITWTGRGATALTSTGRAVDWSPTLGLWVATGSGTNSFATSTDGVTWTGRTGTAIFSSSGFSVYWNAAQNQFIAGGSGTNTMASSLDGIVWAGYTTFNALNMAQVFGLGWNGVYWVAGGVAGTNSIITSFDGITWTGRGTPVTSQVNAVAWNGSLWVAVGSGTNQVATSADGITWISRGAALGGGTGLCLIWYSYRSVWIAGSTGGAYTSPDGITWTNRYSATFVMALAANTTGLVVGGLNSSTTLITSTNGATWTNRSFSGGPSGILGVAFSPSLNLWVAVGSPGTNAIMTSTDGINWTGRTGSTIFSTQGNSVLWNGTFFIATGQGTNNIATSADGITWRGQAQRVAIGPIGCQAQRPPIMVAGGTGTNTIATSDDNGLTWRPRANLGTTIAAIAWNGYIWVATSSSTIGIWTSPDGITWTSRTTPFTTRQRCITWAESLKLWVMGGAGTWSIATSADGVNWTGRHPITNGIFGDVFAIEWNGRQFVALGSPNTSFTVAISINGILWTPTSSTITSPSSAYMGLAWNGFLWVAVTDSATNIWSSIDAITWTSRHTLAAGNGRVVRWNGRQFVVFGSSTGYAFSFDGITWTNGVGTHPFGTSGVTGLAWNPIAEYWVLSGTGPLNDLISMATTTNLVTFVPRMSYSRMQSQVNGFVWAAQLGLWVAVGIGSANIVTSTDGATWIERLSGTNFATGQFVAWNGSLFVAVGGTSAQIFTSTDGITWTNRGNGNVSWTRVNGVTWAPSLNLWVAVGQVGGGTQGIIASSTDGISWTSRNTTIFTNTANAVAWNGSLFVAVGQGTNVFATSTDGLSWAARGATGITSIGYGVVWATAPGVTSQWVAVGTGTNSIATSTDGVTWVGRTATSIFSTQGNQVAHNGFATVAVGQGTNAYAWSYDNGTTWTAGGTLQGAVSGFSIAWNSTTGQWVAGTTSSTNIFLRSPDGINWIPSISFTTTGNCVAMQTRVEKNFTINNSNWTGRTSRQNFRIIG